MSLEFLKPVSDDLKNKFKEVEASRLFRHITFFEHESDFDLSAYDMAILSVDEARNSVKPKTLQVDFDAIRESLYRLHKGAWQTKIIDLGHIAQGDAVEDTYFVVKDLVSKLYKEDVICLVLGGSQDLTLPLYRAFDGHQYMVNLTTIDAKFDLGSADENFSNHSYMGKIIVDEPYNLFNYSNLGFLTFYNAQEEIDLMDQLYFETCRYGELQQDISRAEPTLRDSDLISFDLTSLGSTTLSDPTHPVPNGLNGMEACAISRYSGLSNHAQCFFLSELQSIAPSEVLHELTGQMLWYFIEGFYLRHPEKINSDNKSLTNYKVAVDFQSDEYLEFVKSELTNKWWIKTPEKFLDNNNNKHALLSCSENDYLEACNGILPQKWYYAKLKGYF
ncbi:MAG: formimidoylglutamase [Psychroflexus sp.]|nr:formimidoylglutamase [Psychroflexus sp.]MDN6309580.1 formimidoylglutamase [Psychroflexus sp.]